MNIEMRKPGTEGERGYEALLLASFGGPEKPSDVMPFLENVTRGRNIPRERLATVRDHYLRFGGKSPINDLNRALIDALETELAKRGIDLAIYWGNRNWTPYLVDAVEAMASDGIQRSLALVTSAYSGYSNCRQYLDDIDRAVLACGAAMSIDKIRPFWNHPGFVEAHAENMRKALSSLEPSRRKGARIIFTAHSIPTSMSSTSDYEIQLRDASQLVMDSLIDSGDAPDAASELAFQSRSGSPSDPWLEPDICDHLRSLVEAGADTVVVSPIGFISDHMEVVFDLDVQAREVADEVGLTMVRVATPGTHPLFVSGLVDLVEQYLDPNITPASLGTLGPRRTPCESSCCPGPTRR